MEYIVDKPVFPVAGSTLICDWDETLGKSFQDPKFLNELYTQPNVYKILHPIGEEPVCYSINLEYNSQVSDHKINKPLIFWGVFRPGAIQFLDFVQEKFENVIIWSAGIKPYVHGVCREILQISGTKHPKLIFSRNNCKYNPERDFHHKPIELLKQELIDLKAPINIHPEKTLIVDDKTYTFLENPQNGILIPPFSPKSLSEILDRSDRNLFKLMQWMERPEILNSLDYRLLDKKNIFA